MTDDITIPPEARQAVWEAFVEAAMNLNLSTEECLHAACLAMLSNWPGMRDTSTEGGEPHWQHHLILPLPKEGE